MGFNRAMLPANSYPNRDLIRIEEPNRKPIPATRITQGVRMEKRSDTISPNYNDEAAVDASTFPKLRGW